MPHQRQRLGSTSGTVRLALGSRTTRAATTKTPKNAKLMISAVRTFTLPVVLMRRATVVPASYPLEGV